MHEPSVLFLDEPTSGVDPLARRAFWRMINNLADRGTAILVTTHYLEEAEQCNRLGFMVAGELVAEGTPSGIKAEQPGHLLELTVDRPQQAADFLKEGTERWRVSLFGDRLHVISTMTLLKPRKRLAIVWPKKVSTFSCVKSKDTRSFLKFSRHPSQAAVPTVDLEALARAGWGWFARGFS